ncbi:MAG: hypothetical protein V3V13_09080 [Paracoccaceae bacterium]
MIGTPKIGDGLEAFNSVIDAREIARLVGELARWVAPETFRLLPVWCPETARKQRLYKAGWKEGQTNRGNPKFEGNSKANAALSMALGVVKKKRPNWTCCHIWGQVDDPRYYSCTANMILLPTPLKAFTDSVPEMKAALRIAAFRLYGFLPEGKAPPDVKDAGAWLPNGWDRGQVSGVRPLTVKIEKSATDRKQRILNEFNEPQGEYPHKQVDGVMRYWTEKIPDFEFTGRSHDQNI